jgi:hypothetical protein
MNKIVKMVFGSHLYGTSTSSSDTDYKGIYIPSLKDCILNNISKTINFNTKEGSCKNTVDDVDEEYYSIQYFMKLALQGEMIVIDMLHAPADKIICSSQIWNEVQNNRSRFYSKNLFGYLGYIRKQTAKYSSKGSRLCAIDEVISIMELSNKECKLSTIFSLLPINEFCSVTENPKEMRWKFYQVCGKQISENITIEQAIDILCNLRKSYGSRAEAAKLNNGVDWKAVSHAFRAAEQLKEIYLTGDLKYPLKNCEFIRDVKIGKLHYSNDRLSEKLDTLLDEIENLSLKVSFPNKVDSDWMDSFVLSLYK